MATYTNATSSFAHHRLIAQYGTGAKRYGAVASWLTMAKAFFYDWKGRSLAESLYRSGHPAQLHYGIWDSSKINTFDQSIRRATDVAFQALVPNYDGSPTSLVHLGSGFGGVDIQLCQKFPHLASTGISIDPLQVSVATELANLAGTSARTHFVADNFLKLHHLKNQQFDGGLAMESLCHVPAPQLNLLWKKINQLLKPGARFVIHDAYVSSSLSNQERDQLEVFIKGWDLPQLAQVKAMITAASLHGFRLISNHNLTPFILKSADQIYWRAWLFKPLVRLFQGTQHGYLQSLGLADPETLDFANTGLVQRQLFRNGTLQYRQLVFKKRA